MTAALATAVMASHKRCKGCLVVKARTEFYGNYRTRDGLLNWCKPCIVERYREGRSKRQKEVLAYIQAIKLERGCADCGYRERAEALDFDHLPGSDKKYRIATMAAGLNRAKIDAEIAKCEVVCANCHRVRTADRRPSKENLS